MNAQETNPNQKNGFSTKSGRKGKKPDLMPAVFEQGRIPPQAVDVEEAVLGALMLEENALAAVVDILRPEAFYKEAHQVIFKSIYDLFVRSQPIDIITVTQDLKSKGQLEVAGGAYYITQLTNRVASAANIEFHSRIISQKFIQRELIRISTDTIRDAFEETTDVFDLLDKAEKELFSVSDTNIRREYQDMSVLVRDAIREIEAIKNSENNLRGVPSGFTALDRVTSGWQKSDLIVIAARPGMGKTAFVLSIARNVAVDFKRPVAFFSLEMSAIQLVTRLISSETQLPADKLKKGALESYEWEQLNVKIGKLVEAPLYIDDTPALSIFELRAKCRRLKAQKAIELIVVDYIQLMTTGGENKFNREQEISSISRSLKSLSKELDIPVIALSQLSRAVEKRAGADGRPILSDLRESGAIEQDADLVMFIYRPEYYKIDHDEEGNSLKGVAEINIAKHRNGPLADVRLRFIDKYARFVDYDEEAASSPTDYYSREAEAPPNSITLQSRMNDMDDDEPPF